MGVSAILARLLSFGEADWISLWMIADEVEDELTSDDEDKTLEITVVLVTELLKHGFIAGDSPVSGDSVRFSAWSHQDPGAIAQCIRREWIARGGPPDWHDSPWFAAPPAPGRHA